jgi:hypothetical protein
MSRAEEPAAHEERGGEAAPNGAEPTAGPEPSIWAGRGHRRAYVGALVLLIIIGVVANGALTKPIGASGVPPGARLPAFAVPLVLGNLSGDADIATRPGQGAAGRVPACLERGPRILNLCELYEHGPVVLALFIDEGGCERVLSEMQALVSEFPDVRFAAVSIKGDRAQLRRLVRSDGLTFPVGIDADGALAELYKDASCPQVSFAYRGGVVQRRAVLTTPTLASLRARVGELAAATRARQAGG